MIRDTVLRLLQVPSTSCSTPQSKGPLPSPAFFCSQIAEVPTSLGQKKQTVEMLIKHCWTWGCEYYATKSSYMHVCIYIYRDHTHVCSYDLSILPWQTLWYLMFYLLAYPCIYFIFHLCPYLDLHLYFYVFHLYFLYRFFFAKPLHTSIIFDLILSNLIQSKLILSHLPFYLSTHLPIYLYI